ncbi:nicotinamide mononucleotide transporter [Cupriavidus basilensis]|uniref:nicotinamide mononucleotide transporter n=1 Tax=Cupriavidus basilensis TaxID=68895 RepID=UPI0020A6D0BE|nr:nicotinamide mononucleotide transporter [Cupriavidus basilensis]MCP3019839.1 nicotinamide mononucleotide transporter family protein [Cupriavidus basilensis]
MDLAQQYIPNLLNGLEWSGCALAMSGSLLVALHNKASRWGWIAYLCSNIVWSVFALVTGTYGLFVQQLGFTATSIYGLYRHTQFHRRQESGQGAGQPTPDPA